MHEDLPAPVCPAINTCGSSDRLSNLGFPDMSKPSPTFNGCSEFAASFEESKRFNCCYNYSRSKY